MGVVCREFGARVMNIKVLMGKVPSLFEHSDKNVRAEVSVVISLAHLSWVGGVLYIGQVSGHRTVQVDRSCHQACPGEEAEASAGEVLGEGSTGSD